MKLNDEECAKNSFWLQCYDSSVERWEVNRFGRSNFREYVIPLKTKLTGGSKIA